MPTVNSDNQYTGTQFVYDGNGNPTTYSGHAATYDDESRLTTLLGDTQAYTADGMRSSKQIGTNARTYFLYDGDDVAEYVNKNETIFVGTDLRSVSV